MDPCFLIMFVDFQQDLNIYSTCTIGRDAKIAPFLKAFLDHVYCSCTMIMSRFPHSTPTILESEQKHFAQIKICLKIKFMTPNKDNIIIFSPIRFMII